MKRPEPVLTPSATRLERMLWDRGFTMLSFSKETGISFPTIWRAVRQGKISRKTAPKLAQALKISEKELFKNQIL
jgi:transcriptional regulator with XRE-family HTH domain